MQFYYFHKKINLEERTVRRCSGSEVKSFPVEHPGLEFGSRSLIHQFKASCIRLEMKLKKMKSFHYVRGTFSNFQNGPRGRTTGPDIHDKKIGILVTRLKQVMVNLTLNETLQCVTVNFDIYSYAIFDLQLCQFLREFLRGLIMSRSEYLGYFELNLRFQLTIFVTDYQILIEHVLRLNSQPVELDFLPTSNLQKIIRIFF